MQTFSPVADSRSAKFRISVQSITSMAVSETELISDNDRMHESKQAVVKETKPVWTFLVCILFSYFSKCDRGKIQKAHSCLGRRAFLIIVACFILTVRHLNLLKTRPPPLSDQGQLWVTVYVVIIGIVRGRNLMLSLMSPGFKIRCSLSGNSFEAIF